MLECCSFAIQSLPAGDSQPATGRWAGRKSTRLATQAEQPAQASGWPHLSVRPLWRTLRGSQPSSCTPAEERASGVIRNLRGRAGQAASRRTQQGPLGAQGTAWQPAWQHGSSSIAMPKRRQHCTPSRKAHLRVMSFRTSSTSTTGADRISTMRHSAQLQGSGGSPRHIKAYQGGLGRGASGLDATWREAWD
jgi:hypothetical protein